MVRPLVVGVAVLVLLISACTSGSGESISAGPSISSDAAESTVGTASTATTAIGDTATSAGPTSSGSTATPQTVDATTNSTATTGSTSTGRTSGTTAITLRPTTTKPTTTTTRRTTTSTTIAATTTTTTRPTTTVVPELPLPKVELTFGAATEIVERTATFSVQQTRTTDFSARALNGAAVAVESASPSSKCKLNGFGGVFFIENEAHNGDVCVVKFQVAPIDGYQGNTITMNVVADNDCHETWSIEYTPGTVSPGDDVTFLVDTVRSGAGPCSTSIGCSSVNLETYCYDSGTIDKDACSGSSSNVEASVTVFSTSAGTYLFDSVPATARWTIDCSGGSEESETETSAPSADG